MCSTTNLANGKLKVIMEWGPHKPKLRKPNNGAEQSRTVFTRKVVQCDGKTYITCGIIFMCNSPGKIVINGLLWHIFFFGANSYCIQSHCSA